MSIVVPDKLLEKMHDEEEQDSGTALSQGQFAEINLTNYKCFLSTHADRQGVDTSFTVCNFVCNFGYGFLRRG